MCILDGDFLHFRCCLHVLSKNAMRFVFYSLARFEKFKILVNVVGLE